MSAVTISNEAEMEALDILAVVRDRQNDVWVKVAPRGVEGSGLAGKWGLSWVSYPARVIFVPGADERALVWAQAIEQARQVINNRWSTYEADIDLLALENPYTPSESCQHAWSATSDRGDACLLGCGEVRL